MTREARPKIGLRESMLIVGLVALIVAVIAQSRQLAVQDRRIAALEATIARIEKQNLQLAQGVMAGPQRFDQDLAAMHRELGALNRRQAPAANAALPEALPGIDGTTPQGEWAQDSVEHNGALVSFGDRAAEVRIVVEGDAYRTEADGKVMTRMALTFDPSRTPKELDARYLSGPNKGRVRKGIYRIEGDTWTYCLGPPEGYRPSKFESPAGEDVFLVVARRAGRRGPDAPGAASGQW